MNLAFSAIILSFLAVPGFLFWFGYAIEERNNSRSEWETTFTQLVKGLVTSWLLHCIWGTLAAVVCMCIGLQIELRAVVALAAAAYGDDREYFLFFNHGVECLTAHPYFVSLYFLSLYVGSVILGLLVRYIAKTSGLEHELPFLSYNYWYYVLDADREKQKQKGAIDPVVFLAMTVNHVHGTYVYRGYMEDYDLDERGELSRLTLTKASRRKIADDRPHSEEADKTHKLIDPRFYSLRNRLLVIDYSRITTLSISYVVLKKIGPSAPPPPAMSPV